MARSYSELQREQYGGVRCKGTLQRNKYLCSNCGPSHSPCSHSTSARSNDPVALEQRKMEVCLIGLQPIAMSAPGNASSEECNHHSPRQTNSQAHPRHRLGRRHGKVRQLMVCEKNSQCHSARSRTSRPPCDCFDFSFPRSKRSRNATSTILRILLVRAHRLCIIGDGVTNRLDVPSKGHPQSLAALVTGRVFLPGRLPEGSVRRG